MKLATFLCTVFILKSHYNWVNAQLWKPINGSQFTVSSTAEEIFQISDTVPTDAAEILLYILHESVASVNIDVCDWGGRLDL